MVSHSVQIYTQGKTVKQTSQLSTVTSRCRVDLVKSFRAEVPVIDNDESDEICNVQVRII
jgi:hypothetical protein